MKASKSNPALKRIIAATFPEWKGRKLRVEARTTYTLANAWGGGSRDYAMAYNLTTGEVAPPSPAASNAYNHATFATIEIPPGIAIVEHSIFMGKDAGISIYVHPSNMPAMLPAEAAS